MQKLIFSLFLSLLAITTYGQKKQTPVNFNFGCETIVGGKPLGWDHFGNSAYLIAIDSTQVKSGKYSISIQSSGEKSDFKAWAFTIPNSYPGKKITLYGFVKTENVTDGYAGLWMRIDPSIAFDNMNEKGIKGTTEWQKYEITLNLKPEKTTQIVIGGLLVGKGKMWLDDFQVAIDGNNIETIKPIAPIEFLADKDTAFSNGSQINNITLDNTKIENLKHLGLIWGFLKYYHPNIAKGNYNWDYELFRILPKVLSASTNAERDATFVTWIQKLGEFEVGKEKSLKSKEVKLYPDLDWIQNSNYTPELTALLTKVKNAKRTDFNYYIDLIKGVGNPDFKNENPYDNLKDLDAGYRILALYRYWNMIQYYFPNKHLIEEDWKNVLTEFIPKFVNTKNMEEYTLSVLEIIARVHDTHANIWGKNDVLTKHYGVNYTAIDLKFIEEKAVVVGFSDSTLGKETKLEIGDIITSVNNKSVTEIVKDRLKTTPASNYPTQLRDLASLLLRSNDSLINIGYIHNGNSYSKTIKTYPTSVLNPYKKYQTTDTCFKWITKDIAYIHNGNLKREYLPKLFSEIRSAKGLIIDDRNYPMDFPIYELSNYLLSKEVPFVKFSKGSVSEPGLFKFNVTMNAGKKNKDYFKGKVVIMVNEETQSSAEYHALAYRTIANNVVIGSTTAGADGNVSEIHLPGNISSYISGIGVYYPDGRETQRVGIVPDVEVKPTIEGIKSGRDEVLEKAIEIINGK